MTNSAERQVIVYVFLIKFIIYIISFKNLLYKITVYENKSCWKYFELNKFVGRSQYNANSGKSRFLF